MVHNLKADSNLEFGGQRTVEEYERSAKGSKEKVGWQIAKTTPPPRWHMAILGRPPLYPRGDQVPPQGVEVARRD